MSFVTEKFRLSMINYHLETYFAVIGIFCCYVATKEVKILITKPLRSYRHIKYFLSLEKWTLYKIYYIWNINSFCPVAINKVYAYVVKFRRTHRVFHLFRQAKFDNGGSILSSSPFLLLPQKMELASKVVKIDSKQSAR